jgi:hypothetical protein
MGDWLKGVVQHCITLLMQTSEPGFVRGQRQITIDWDIDVERHDAEVMAL